jgi:hypothetical protein
MLRSHVVFYSKVMLLAIGVALVIGIALCSGKTTPISLSLPIPNTENDGSLMISAQYENQCVYYVLLSVSGPENFQVGVGTEIASPYCSMPYMSPGTYTVSGTYEGMSCSENFVISTGQTTYVTLIFVGTPKFTITTTTPYIIVTTIPPVITTPLSTTTTATEFYGPTYTSDLGGGTRLEVLLSSSSVNVGETLWMRVKFTGPNANSASCLVRLTVTNSSGENVYDICYWHSAGIFPNGPPQDVTSYSEWEAKSSPTADNVEVTPRAYSFFLGDSFAWGVRGTIEVKP